MGVVVMQPFNTHEKREFVKLYVAAYMGSHAVDTAFEFKEAVYCAEEAWQNALEAGLIQDHDAEPVSPKVNIGKVTHVAES